VNTEQLAEWLQRRLPRIPRLSLNSSRIKVTHVLNWGGFVNHSFSIDDGSVQYHLKITDDLESIMKLQLWRRIQSLLKQRYKAPEVIDWLDFPEIGFAGLLQQRIVGGRAARFRDDPVLLKQLIELASRLHEDADLRSILSASGSPKTYLDHFAETYIDRFNADMEAIERGRLPFLSSALLQWMRDEAGRLRAAAESVQAFHDRANDPVHGDLNEGNVIVTPNEWFVVDWDDLALGDPAVEFAVLVWPIVYQGGDWTDLNIPNVDSGFKRRIEVCFRAQLLDEVIDPLADYVAAGAVPSKQDEVQFVKRQRHEEALERYRLAWYP
jgi:aminoglycoside phosphotransferase (APT) family kinase protein